MRSAWLLVAAVVLAACDSGGASAPDVAVDDAAEPAAPSTPAPSSEADDQFCAALDELGVRLQSAGADVDTAEDPLSGLMAAAGGLAEAHRGLLTLAEVAPAELQADYEAVAGLFDPQHSLDVIDSPIKALASGLWRAGSAQPAIERVDTHAEETCGMPVFGQLSLQASRELYPRRDGDTIVMNGSEFFGELLCNTRPDFHARGDVIAMICGPRTIAFDADTFEVTADVTVPEGGTLRTWPGHAVRAWTEVHPVDGLDEPTATAYVEVVELATGETTRSWEAPTDPDDPTRPTVSHVTLSGNVVLSRDPPGKPDNLSSDLQMWLVTADEVVDLPANDGIQWEDYDWTFYQDRVARRTLRRAERNLLVSLEDGEVLLETPPEQAFELFTLTRGWVGDAPGGRGAPYSCLPWEFYRYNEDGLLVLDADRGRYGWARPDYRREGFDHTYLWFAPASEGLAVVHEDDTLGFYAPEQVWTRDAGGIVSVIGDLDGTLWAVNADGEAFELDQQSGEAANYPGRPNVADSPWEFIGPQWKMALVDGRERIERHPAATHDCWDDSP